MSAVAARKRINSNASTSGRPNAPGTRVNAQAPQRAAASVSQGNSSEIADKSLNNLGPVEMNAILLMETGPPTLTHTYNNNYQPGELLTDRFGFIYDQRRKTRQTAGPIVALTTGDDNPLRGASFGADLERFCWDFSMLYLL